MRGSRRLRLTLALLLLTSLTLVTLDFRAGGSSVRRGARTVAAAVFGPAERAVSAVARPVRQTVVGIAHLGGYQAEATRLRRDNDTLRSQLRMAELDRRRATELDQLLRVAGAGQYKVVPAQVVGLGGALGFESTATIDAGSRDGLRPDMTVLSGRGLVGRVKAVGPFSATVLLATDRESSVGARLAGSLQVGAVTGDGMRPLTLQLFDPQAKLVRGDRLVTFGSAGSRPFVPGVPIGAVSQIESTPGALTRSALVQPYVDFGGLDLVGVVVQPPRQDPRDAVLPPPPGPAG